MIVIWIVLGVVVGAFLVTALFGAPYVPSLDSRTKIAFDELYTINENDLLVDIGSGDGRVMREARLRGARTLGYEINPFLVIVANLLSLRDSKIHTKWTDYRMQTLPRNTTVVYVFGVTRDIESIVGWVDKQAKDAGREVYVLVFGSHPKNYPVMRRNSSHFLYRVGALQGSGRSV